MDGRPLSVESGWDDVCWQTDDDADYLEIEAQLTDGWRLQRQIFLAHRDRFVLLADALLGEQPAALQYRSSLPVGADVEFEPAPETTEGFLVAGKRRALVLPLALPEWQSAVRGEKLAATPAGLELRVAVRGRSLFAPLFIDLDRRRIDRPATWRQLTVGENSSRVPRDFAAGFRVQRGRQQWLFYRSLIAGGVRSVLGQQLTREFMAGRFQRSGCVHTLLEIEMA